MSEPTRITVEEKGILTSLLVDKITSYRWKARQPGINKTEKANHQKRSGKYELLYWKMNGKWYKDGGGVE